MPSFPDPDPALAGPTAQLRFAAERDIPEILIAHQDDPQLYVVLGLKRPPSGAELGRRIERQPADRADGTGAWLTIVRAGGDRCCGQVQVHDVDADHRRAQLDIWLAPDARGTGLGRAALALAGRWLLHRCKLARVDMLVEPANHALIRAAIAAGFVAEGELRNYLRRPDGRVDVRVLSMIDADPVVS